MRSRAAASIIGDRTRDRMPSECEFGDRRHEDRGSGAAADLDLAHEAEGVAGVENIGHRASPVRAATPRGRDRQSQRSSSRMRHERQAGSKRIDQAASIGGARRVDVVRIHISSNIGHVEICLHECRYGRFGECDDASGSWTRRSTSNLSSFSETSFLAAGACALLYRLARQ